MMLSRLLGSKSRDAEYWQKRLAQARHYLWEGDLKRAEALFAQLAAEVEAERQGDDQLQAVRLDAQLGQWAVLYLRDPQQGGLYRHLTDNRAVSGDRWYFVARAFMSRGDTGEAALQAYQSLLAAKAHRCLGYIAERGGDWATAKRHYTASGDNLQRAVVSAKNND